MKLSRLAVRDVISVVPGDSIDKAIGLMEEFQIHHLPVIETGIVVGMVSDRDILVSVGWKLSSERREDHGDGPVIGPKSVAEIMSQPVLTMSPSDTVQEAALSMVDRKVGAIVVAREGHAHGIFTKVDLLMHATDMAASQAAKDVLKQAVGDHMRASVITATPKQSITEVASLMHRNGLRHIPVVAAEMCVGVVSDRDLRRAFGSESIEDGEAQGMGHMYVPPGAVMEIMTRDVQSISPRATLLDAAERMATRRIGCLPVTMEDRLIGIITDTDLIRIIAHLDA